MCVCIYIYILGLGKTGHGDERYGKEMNRIMEEKGDDGWGIGKRGSERRGEGTSIPSHVVSTPTVNRGFCTPAGGGSIHICAYLHCAHRRPLPLLHPDRSLWASVRAAHRHPYRRLISHGGLRLFFPPRKVREYTLLANVSSALSCSHSSHHMLTLCSHLHMDPFLHHHLYNRDLPSSPPLS